VKVLLVDGNSVGWAVWYALPLSVRESEDIGYVCGVWRHAFLVKLVKFVRKYGEGRALHTLIVWDGEGGVEARRRLCESYKRKRRESRKQMVEREDINLRYFEALGEFISLLHQTSTGKKFLIRFNGLEADDVVAGMCDVMSKKGISVFVYSSDTDLLQVLKFSGVRVFSPREDKEWTVNKVKRKYGVEPRHLWLYKAVVGDSADGWTGVRGVGEKRFRETVSRLGVKGAMLEWSGEEVDIGRKLCKLPAEWLLREAVGEEWRNVFLGELERFLQVEVDPAELALTLNLRRLSTAELQYLM